MTKYESMDKYIKLIEKDSIRNFPYEFPKSLTNGNKLILTGVIGGGGFSNTYQGNYYDRKDSNLSSGEKIYTEVIVKEFFIRNECNRKNDNEIEPLDLNKFNKYREKFKEESKTLSKLNHPYVIKVYSSFDANGTSYYVMKKIEGLTLNEYVARHGCMNLKDALRILQTAFEALKYVHDSKFLHLDIKPDNLITSETGFLFNTYLIDFGLCKSIKDDTLKAKLSGSRQAGSPGYSPFELSITRDKDGKLIELDTATDIYSLGATLYFLLTGLHSEEWSTLSISGLFYPAYADPRGELILKNAMQIKPENRIQNVDQFVMLCQEALKQPLSSDYDENAHIPMPNDKGEASPNAKYIKLSEDRDSSSSALHENADIDNSLSYQTEILNPAKEPSIKEEKSNNQVVVDNNKDDSALAQEELEILVDDISNNQEEQKKSSKWIDYVMYCIPYTTRGIMILWLGYKVVNGLTHWLENDNWLENNIDVIPEAAPAVDTVAADSTHMSGEDKKTIKIIWPKQLNKIKKSEEYLFKNNKMSPLIEKVADSTYTSSEDNAEVTVVLEAAPVVDSVAVAIVDSVAE